MGAQSGMQLVYWY